MTIYPIQGRYPFPFYTKVLKKQLCIISLWYMSVLSPICPLDSDWDTKS